MPLNKHVDVFAVNMNCKTQINSQLLFYN